MCLFIGSFHPYMGLLAAAAFLCVGVAVPLIISKVSGNTGDEIRGQSGELAALVLENIRGLNETIQYGKGNERMDLMNSRTDALSQKQSALNKLTGTNIAIANTFRTCLHKKCVRIFEHNFAEKTCAYACEDGFLFESSCSPLDLQAKMVYNKTTANMMIKRR